MEAKIEKEQTDYGNTIVDVQLARYGNLAVSSRLRCKIYNHAPLFHRGYHVLGDELWSRLARNQSRRNDDVNFFALVHEEAHFLLDELLAHYLGITTNASTVFLEGDLKELPSETFDLFSRSRTSVESSNNSTHATSCGNGGQTRNTGTNDQNFTLDARYFNF